MQRVYEENEWGKVSKRIVTNILFSAALEFSTQTHNPTISTFIADILVLTKPCLRGLNPYSSSLLLIVAIGAESKL